MNEDDGWTFAVRKRRRAEFVRPVGPAVGISQGERMPRNVSPGVERATAAVAERASRPTLADWLAVLLADDDGRPAHLLVSVGVPPEGVRRLLEQPAPLAPDTQELIAIARRYSLALRSDPEVTTDVVFLAVATTDAAYSTAIGLPEAEIASLLAPSVSAAKSSATFTPPTAFTVAESPDQTTAARVIDANLNRSREALRVLDDFARFHLNDATLTGELKLLRHDLAAAVERLPANALLAARDTDGDVGTTLTAAGEYDRGSARVVAAVNTKRLQEALRSCEEFGKLFDAEFARQVERIRYAAYSLERTLLRGHDARDRLADAKLYVLLTASRCVAAMDWTIAEAAAGGATVFQLREKEMPDRELIARARDVRRWTRKAGVLFVVNDRPDIAALAEADGVHLGQDDLTVADARRVVGPDALIGVSTHDPDQVRRAVLDGADYLGVGPTFPSTTKEFPAFPGLLFVSAAFATTSLPAFALGGISPANVAAVVAAGATRVAVSAAVTMTDDPQAVARSLVAAMT